MKKTPSPANLPQICNYGIFSEGLKNEFETAVVKRAISFRAIETLLFYIRIFTMYPAYLELRWRK